MAVAFVFVDVFTVLSFFPGGTSGRFSSFSSLFFNPTLRLLLFEMLTKPPSSEADHEELVSSSSSSSSEEKLSKYSFVSANSPSPPLLDRVAAEAIPPLSCFNRKYECGGGGDDDDIITIAAPAGANIWCFSIEPSRVVVVFSSLALVVASLKAIFSRKISSRICFIFFESSLRSRANSARSQLCATLIMDSEMDARCAKSRASLDSPRICVFQRGRKEKKARD